MDNLDQTTPDQVHNPELLGLADELERDEQAALAEQDKEAVAAAVEQNQGALELATEIVKKAVAAAVALGAQKWRGLENIWTDDVIHNTAHSTAVLLCKYDVSAPEFVGKYAEEINFIMTVSPPMFGTYLLMKAQAEAAKEARKHPVAPLMPPEQPTPATEFTT